MRAPQHGRHRGVVSVSPRRVLGLAAVTAVAIAALALVLGIWSADQRWHLTAAVAGGVVALILLTLALLTITTTVDDDDEGPGGRR